MAFTTIRLIETEVTLASIAEGIYSSSINVCVCHILFILRDMTFYLRRDSFDAVAKVLIKKNRIRFETEKKPEAFVLIQRVIIAAALHFAFI